MVGHVVVRSGYPDAFFFRNLGLGLDGRAVTRDHGSVDALVFSLAARASAITGFGGLGAELLAGVGEPRHGSAQGLMSVGFFWSLYALEAGYSYQFPLTGGRADWMSSHQFSVRINVPFYRQDKVTTDHPR